MTKLAISTLAAVAVLFASSFAYAGGANLPVCEQMSRTNPTGKRVPVAVMLPAADLNLKDIGIARFVTEIHVSPEQVSVHDGKTNRVREVMKCTYLIPGGQAVTVTHVKLWALRADGDWDGYIASAIELPSASVAKKVLFRTKIGDTRYIGEWQEYKGHPVVLLKKQ